jgi:hypothetical protein
MPSSLTSYFVRLLEVSQEQGYYVTLSHCWGPREHQPLRTTLNPDTFSQYKAGIKIEDMPKTFRDAVELTRRIGPRYLWIDSLCIIQDSKEDWETESAKMASIYHNALLTLAASVAPDSRHGLYVDTDEQYIDRPLSSLTGQDEDESIRFRKPLPHKAVDHLLMSRAWVLQERLLSPRVLHFGQQELIWECWEDMTCECSGFAIKVFESHDQWLEPKAYVHPSILSGLSQNAVVTMWHYVVTSYSTMMLSVEADILPAISGIARIVQEAWKGEYLAGLWKKSLVSHLCWRAREAREARRPREWRAPTFSWASVVANARGVDYSFMDPFKTAMSPNLSFQHIEIVDANCCLAGLDETGAVLSGYILLIGTLVQATVAYDQLAGHWKVTRFGKQMLDATFAPDYRYDVDEPHHVESGQVVYLLKVLSKESKTAETGEQQALFLVLRKVDVVKDHLRMVSVADDDYEVFERIGLYVEFRDGEDKLELISRRETVFTDVKVQII